MSLLIDGYNLLNAVGIIPKAIGPGGLERSRLALLNFLAESLEPAEISHTTVVFDARNAPPGLPRVVDHRGLTVRFASAYEDADSLIEELIGADSAPRRLTVVSSDHRLQRAARRRRAHAVDSDVWYAETTKRRRQRRESAADVPARPVVPLLEEDVDYWIRQFGGTSALTRFIEEEMAEEPPAEPAPAEDTLGEKPSPDEFANPFPPGYAEDLLKGDESGTPDDLFPPNAEKDADG